MLAARHDDDDYDEDDDEDEFAKKSFPKIIVIN